MWNPKRKIQYEAKSYDSDAESKNNGQAWKRNGQQEGEREEKSNEEVASIAHFLN
jgi:hypothetical protein